MNKTCENSIQNIAQSQGTALCSLPLMVRREMAALPSMKKGQVNKTFYIHTM